MILDAKRGDIGSTAEQYAREAFERYQADAVTLSPFMGFDSVEPWLAYEDKGLFLLCRTSNPAVGPAGAAPGHRRPGLRTHRAARAGVEPHRPARPGGGRRLPGRDRVRELAPTLPLLIPGVGAQGGDRRRHGARRLARAGGHTALRRWW